MDKRKTTRNITTPKSHHSKTKRGATRRGAHRWHHRMPRWTFWVGGLVVTVLYCWAFYYFFVGPTGFRWRALYGESRYPKGFEIHGIDISHYQGNIDWDKLQGGMISGCPLRFVIIKSTEGASRMDENFKSNFHNALEYGFIRGAYHFWSNKSSARQQAYYFLEKVKLEEGDLPPVLDIEHAPKDKSIEEFQRDILTWLHIVEDRYHVKPILYTYYKFKEKYLSAPRNSSSASTPAATCRTCAVG